MANSIKVKKRNGEYVDFDIQKIKDMLGWACEELDVNPLELETSLTITLADGVSTSAIHKNSIKIASGLISVEEPDWRYVAGRLHISEYVKEVELSRGFGYGGTKEFIEYQRNRGVYGDYVTFTDEEYDLADHLIDPDKDMLFDISGAIAMTDRYCLKDELPQELFMTISMVVSKKLEELYGFEFDSMLNTIYSMASSLELSFSTPLLLNLRRPKPNLSSCYIIKPSDDMSSIYDNIKNLAMISKNAGGVGFNLDSIRAEGSWIKGTKGAASGVVPLVKVLNDTAVYVNQEGKRAGAVSPSLSAWHLDLLEFFEIQLEEGDQRTKSFDVMPQVIYNDLFFDRCDNDEQWTMFDPYEIKKVAGVDLSRVYGDEFTKAYLHLEELAKKGELELVKSVRARDIFKAHYKAMRIKGMPYVIFKDTIAKGNPNKHSGSIFAANICVESFSNFDEDTLSHTCNLVSVNVARCIEDTLEKTLDKIYKVSKISTYVLDATIDLGHPSITSSVRHNELYRTIGVGILGQADLMAWFGVSYETEKGIALGTDIVEVTALGAVQASTDMAERSEPYHYFVGSEWSKGNLLGKPWEEFVEKARFKSDWKILRDRVMKVGMRNGQVMAIAPNSSTGVLQGVSPSILPAWKLMYVETMQLGNVIRLPLFVKERALFYKPYPQVDMEKMIEYVASIQTFVDSGISFELVLDLTNEAKSNVRYWFKLVRMAQKLGIKTLYYTRFLTESGVNELDNSCIACKN